MTFIAIAVSIHALKAFFLGGGFSAPASPDPLPGIHLWNSADEQEIAVLHS